MISLLFNTVSASDRSPTQVFGGPGLEIQITSATDFCMFLPPLPNQSIAASEGYPHASPEIAKDWYLDKQLTPGLLLIAHKRRHLRQELNYFTMAL
jgi:hypothetical protein